jgi:hypothetical protein
MPEKLIHTTLEDDLHATVEQDLAMQAMAKKFAPRSAVDRDYDPIGLDPVSDTYADMTKQLRDNNYAKPPAKRSMTPVEHMAESLGNLNKALADVGAFHDRMLGPNPKQLVPEKPSDIKKPLVGQMHDQANDVARMAMEISSLIAKLRETL